MKPAVFLDRDGTIIEDRGHLHSPEQISFIPSAIKALQELQKTHLLFIVTHQSGIAKGLITAKQAQSVNDAVVNRLAANQIAITAVYTCPHAREEGCACIKPNPHTLHEAARDYDVDLSASHVVGDHPHDYELALNAGAHGIYVLTGHGRKHFDELPPETVVAKDIAEAATIILTRNRPPNPQQET
ncbi:MAG: D-glycero-alpha-D-manno-heptose-1,7-bisphosphate 7-phosphatase [Verrucomicrobiota bacterium]